jgi:amidase
MSESLKLTMLCGRYSNDRYGGWYYAMARNLALELTAAYDAALGDADVLVLPTLPIVASVLPAADANREDKLARSLEMIANTAPFDVTGHPATSVPAGLADGLPVGMMIVGRHLADGTCLRVARLRERRRRLPRTARVLTATRPSTCPRRAGTATQKRHECTQRRVDPGKEREISG